MALIVASMGRKRPPAPTDQPLQLSETREFCAKVSVKNHRVGGGCAFTGKSVQEDSRLTGQFCRKSVYQDNFFGVIRLTGQFENLDRLAVLVITFVK